MKNSLKKNLLIFGFLVLLLTAAILITLLKGNQGPGRLPSAEKDRIAAFVRDFGEKLNDVSTLSPPAGAIRKAYGDYVSEELLFQWEENPQIAPGRVTSSPWPAGIDVTTVRKTGQDTFEVTGKVIFMTSVEKTSKADDNAGTAEVLLTVQKGNSKSQEASWTITGFDTKKPSGSRNDWETYAGKGLGFSISYPESWQFAAGKSGSSQAMWSHLSPVAGEILATISTPARFMDDTNFREARLTIGTSAAPSAVENCLGIPENTTPDTRTEPVTLNGIRFVKISRTEGAAGHRYEVSSYRTEHNGACLAIEYYIAYSPLAFYGEDQGITEFDKATVEDTFQKIVETFTFLME